MSETNSANEVLDFAGEDKSKLPSGLNVLTILTIIGSILAIIGSVWGFISAKTNYDNTKKALESGDMDKLPGWAKGMISPETLAMQLKMLENKWPLLILGLIGGVLCLYGAIEMRKRKKQGYLLWLIGELLPIVSLVIFIGMSALSGFGLINVFVALIFIILYTVNRKELIY